MHGALAEAQLSEQICSVGEWWTRPSVLYRPRVFLNGKAWCCLYGENIQEGVVAFGDTPEEAVSNFDFYAWRGKPIPVQALQRDLATVKQEGRGE